MNKKELNIYSPSLNYVADSSLVTVRTSSIHSQGVFAMFDIVKGARIIEYVGEKITAKESGRRVDVSIESNKNNQSNGAVYIFELNKRYEIGRAHV